MDSVGAPRQSGGRSSDVQIQPSAADRARVPFVDPAGFALAPGGRRPPRWLREDGLCFVGCWEAMAWRCYSCIATTWVERDYAFEHSQAFLDDIKRLGCNAVIVPYDYGHGEDACEEDVQASKAFIELAHRNGLRVGTYFRADNVWTESLNGRERAELDGGYQIDAQGRFLTAFGSSGRLICHHHAGVMARFQRHVRRAILDLKTDMLHLDGMIVGGGEGGGACRCPRCVEDFRRFLVARYGHDRELARSRFGHSCLEQIEPPFEYGIDTAPYDSGPTRPHWCEWVAFRCEWTTRILAQVAAWVQELNPDIVIEINNALPAVRENAALMLGTDLIGTGQFADASWSEDGYPPALLPDGRLIHRVRQFKLCRASNGSFALTYMEQASERELRQNLAHTAAFNLGNIGCIGFPPHMNFSNRYTVHFQTKCDFMRWLNEHRTYYRDARSAAQIALWRPRESMALGGRMTYAAAMRMEQLLVETSRAFDIVFEESPAALAAYDLVIVPNVECMSLDQITGLTDHVRNGGRLFVGQNSAMFDLWHRRRIENPWAALFGDVSARNVVADAVAVGAAGVFVAAQAAAKDGPVARVTLGQGRAAYAPLVVDPVGQPSLLTVHGGLNTGLDYTNWVVPEHAAEFSDAIDWLLEGRETVRVTGPRGLLAEVMRQDEPRRRLVHLVNLAHAPLSGCEVRIRGAVAARDIQILHPPADTTPRWDVEEEGGVVRVRLDELDVYAVVVAKGLSDLAVAPDNTALKEETR